ncbi:MAG: tetratricopeptide repeat protein [Candidatus Gastranaerophilaceae bacterium]
MNRKALFLLASAILSTGVVVANSASVEAKVVDTHYNGAIIRQLQKDNSKEYYEIIDKYSYDETDFDFQIDLIEYYEEHSDFAKADLLFENLVSTVKNADSYTKKVYIQKYRDLLDKKLIMQPNSPRYYYLLYIWEKNFGNDINFTMYNLKQALSLDSANVYYKYEYAKQSIGTSENRNAVAILNSLKKAHPRESEFRKSLGDAYKYEGMFEEALKEYQVALVFEPNNSKIINAIENIDATVTQYGNNIQPVVYKASNSEIQPAVDKKVIKAKKKQIKRLKKANAKSRKKNTSLKKKKNKLNNGDITSSNTTKSAVYPVEKQDDVGMSNPKYPLSDKEKYSFDVSSLTKEEASSVNKQAEQTVGSSKVNAFSQTIDKNKVQTAVQKQSTASLNTDIYIKANELMAQSRYEEVISLLQNIQPATLRSITSIASCYNALGQPETAIEYYKQADKLSPQNTQILYSIGYLYFAKNDFEAAKQYADLALAADSSNINAKDLLNALAQKNVNSEMNQAIAYMNKNDYKSAKKILDKFVKTNSEDFQVYYYLGHIAYATAKYEDAAKNFGMAIRYNPEYPLSYYSIGLTFDKLKEFSKSRSAYEQFIQLETDDNKYTQYAKTRINTIKSKQ